MEGLKRDSIKGIRKADRAARDARELAHAARLAGKLDAHSAHNLEMIGLPSTSGIAGTLHEHKITLEISTSAVAKGAAM